LDRRDAVGVVVAAIVGIAIGLGIHYLDSLAPDRVLFRTVAWFAIGVGFILFLAAGALQLAAGRFGLMIAGLVSLVGAIVAYPVGPAIAAGVAVPGSYSMTVELPGVAPVGGPVVCLWAPGRERVASLTGQQIQIYGITVVPSVFFYAPRASLDLPTGEPAYVTYSGGLPPAGNGAPPPTADDASGTVRIDFVATDPSYREAAFAATLHWECQPAPAA
jgi:hypothetical protein